MSEELGNTKEESELKENIGFMVPFINRELSSVSSSTRE